jgi:hypothetical protein
VKWIGTNPGLLTFTNMSNSLSKSAGASFLFLKELIVAIHIQRKLPGHKKTTGAWTSTT